LAFLLSFNITDVGLKSCLI